MAGPTGVIVAGSTGVVSADSVGVAAGISTGIVEDATATSGSCISRRTNPLPRPTAKVKTAATPNFKPPQRGHCACGSAQGSALAAGTAGARSLQSHTAVMLSEFPSPPLYAASTFADRSSWGCSGEDDQTSFRHSASGS